MQVPRVTPRLVALPRAKGETAPWHYIYLSSLIKANIADLFPGLILEEVHAFRITRNSDLYIDEEEAENLLRTIEQELRALQPRQCRAPGDGGGLPGGFPGAAAGAVQAAPAPISTRPPAPSP